MNSYDPLETLNDFKEEPKLDMRWMTPIKLFKKYFTDKLLSEIVDFTNSYANFKLSKMNLSKYSYFHYWRDLSLKELKVFIAIIISMGIHGNKKISNNWSKNPLLSTSYSKYMSLKRFYMISSLLHLSDIDDEGYDKVRILLKRFNLVSPRLLRLSKYLTIDENLYPFKGRFKLRQYIKTKPKKYGLKFFLLCSNSGFCYKMNPYEKKENMIFLIENLIKGFDLKKHILLTDNWYTTLDLAKHLTNKGIGYIGMIRESRLLDRSLKNVKLAKNTFKVSVNETEKQIMITSVRDKRLFHILSNCHHMDQNDSGSPSIIKIYNLHSKGVDRNNQLCRTYRFQHSSRKWWKKVFYYMLEIVTSNCYMIYKHKEDISHENFNLSICKSLLNT